MITLEQVRLLDRKVNQAVEFILELKEENKVLSDKLESYQKKISELEVLLSSLKDDQSEVEQGFQKALETLSNIEAAQAAVSSDTEPSPSSAEAESEAASSETDLSDDAEDSVNDDEETETNAELDIFLVGPEDHHMGKEPVEIDILGTTLKVNTDEDPRYLSQIIHYLKEKTDEVKSSTRIEDPLKISILTSIFIIDELYKERYQDDDKELPAEFSELAEGMLKKLDDSLTKQ